MSSRVLYCPYNGVCTQATLNGRAMVSRPDSMGPGKWPGPRALADPAQGRGVWGLEGTLSFLQQSCTLHSASASSQENPPDLPAPLP